MLLGIRAVVWGIDSEDLATIIPLGGEEASPYTHARSKNRERRMHSLWDDEEARQYPGDLGQRVYTSRLLGRDKSLVLHGGGNTSVKVREPDLFGEERDVLYVKGSGWDLEFIEAEGFAPVDLNHLRRLAELEALSDPEMVNELKTHTLRADAPTPSVEAILHAVIPAKYVDHTHADALLSLTNNPEGERHVRAVYGDRVLVLPYVMPGFDLARECARLVREAWRDDLEGLVLMNHGLFTFGATARESYERMIRLVDEAERYLEARGAWAIHWPDLGPTPMDTVAYARLRADISRAAGRPMVLLAERDDAALGFARHPEVERIARQGPATPDHVIRTKRLPLIGRDVAAYEEEYIAYFEAHAPHAAEPKTMLDPAPRVVLDREFGLCCAGRTPKEAAIVRDIYRHTMDVILRAEALGGYRALPAKDIFDMEYWSLEQAKLARQGEPPELAGEVALVTGAASGIGRATVASLRARGAAVIALDVDEAVHELDGVDCLTLGCDVTDPDQVEMALEAGVEHFGGVDMAVLNAGVFPPGTPIAELDEDEWRRVMAVNLDANLSLMRRLAPYLALAPRGGRVLVMGSKNVAAPGPGAAAYSASKAALTQLARVAALEWAGQGVRVNVLHPDAVFDTGIWSDEVLAARAAHYGLSLEEYKRKNLLGVELESRDVAELTAVVLGPVFAKVTGAQIPIDGGNERVI